MELEAFKNKLAAWEKEGYLRDVSIKANGKRAKGKLALQVFTQGDRTRRTIQTGAIWLVITGVSAAIPVLHFFLVPIFFLIGVICTSFSYGRKQIILGGIGVCPLCEEEFSFATGGGGLPFGDTCTACGRMVEIALVGGRA